MTRKLQLQCEKWKLLLNTNTTKYKYPLVGAESSDIILGDNSVIESCQDYNCLGVIIDHPGTDNKDIRPKVTKKKTMECLNSIFSSQGIYWRFFRRGTYNIYDTTGKSTLLNVSETWWLTEDNKNRIEAVKIYVFRRSFRISRLERLKQMMK